MRYEFITTERRGNILQVTLNRPEVYNAMHPPMHHELAQVWDAYSADPKTNGSQSSQGLATRRLPLETI